MADVSQRVFYSLEINYLLVFFFKEAVVWSKHALDGDPSPLLLLLGNRILLKLERTYRTVDKKSTD